jgi:type IV pilus biogenesis protein CpaD/CtpE
MKFRNMTIPKLNRPATMPFLAHSDFSAQVSRFLRNHVLKYKEIAIPLRLPTSKLREAAAQTLSGFLHNYKKYEHKHPVQDPTRLTCSCSRLIAEISEDLA